MDSLAGIAGACAIASWSYGLIRATGAIFLDVNPDRDMAASLHHAIEDNGDKLADLHIWRLGLGHLGAIVSVLTQDKARNSAYNRAMLTRFPSPSHLTIEVQNS